MYGTNPLISAAVELDAYTADDNLDLDEINMLGAFQVVDFRTKESKIDPNYVKWEAYLVESDGSEDISSQQVPLHFCDDSDWESFENPTK